MKKTSGDFEYWLINTFLGAAGLYVVYLIGNALLGNGIDMHRRIFGFVAHAGPYYFKTEPGKFCGMMFIYVFLLGGIIYYMRQRAQDRKFQLEMMHLRGER